MQWPGGAGAMVVAKVLQMPAKLNPENKVGGAGKAAPGIRDRALLAYKKWRIKNGQ
jgi:hypothetical protein